jgi:hypothetical protein
MRRFRTGGLVKAAVLGGLGVMLAGIACNPELSLNDVLRGKSCRATKPYCVQPYVCNLDTKFCVMPDELPPDAGDSSANAISDRSPAGAEGAPQAVSTSGDPVAGGEGGAAGSESDAAGAGGVSAGPAVGDVDAGCKLTLFRDLDGDGYGSPTSAPSKLGCSEEKGWVLRGDDCFDAEPTSENKAAQVHPEQAMFFATGYPVPGGEPGEVSFDYNCSLDEESDPTNDPNYGAQDCTSQPADCGGLLGIQPTDRSGPGVSNLCGSKIVNICAPQGNRCIVAVTKNTEFRCH